MSEEIKDVVKLISAMFLTTIIVLTAMEWLKKDTYYLQWSCGGNSGTMVISENTTLNCR